MGDGPGGGRVDDIVSVLPWTTWTSCNEPGSVGEGTIADPDSEDRDLLLRVAENGGQLLLTSSGAIFPERRFPGLARVPAMRVALLEKRTLNSGALKLTYAALRPVEVLDYIRDPGASAAVRDLAGEVLELRESDLPGTVPGTTRFAGTVLPPPGRRVRLTYSTGASLAAFESGWSGAGRFAMVSPDLRVQSLPSTVSDAPIVIEEGDRPVIAALTELVYRAEVAPKEGKDDPKNYTFEMVSRGWAKVRTAQFQGDHWEYGLEPLDDLAAVWHGNRVARLDDAAIGIMNDEIVEPGSTATIAYHWDVDRDAIDAAYTSSRRLLLMPPDVAADGVGHASLVEILMVGSGECSVHGLAHVDVAGLLQVHPYQVLTFSRDGAEYSLDSHVEDLGARLRRRVDKIRVAQDDVATVRAELAAQPLSKEARSIADSLLERAETMPATSSDRGSVLTRLRSIAALPWREPEPIAVTMQQVSAALDDQLALMQPVKRRVVENLAANRWWEMHRDAATATQRPRRTLLLVGPPGVGKTAICHAASRALQRPLEVIAMGGATESTFFVGSDSVYIGASCGALAAALQRAGRRDVLLLLDEIDKTEARTRRGVAGVLLDLLDPAHTDAVRDLYLGFHIDLSHVTFVATANSLQSIDPAILDRCEVIEVGGYSDDEKSAMARSHLIPGQLRQLCLDSSQVTITDDAVDYLVAEHSEEPGVRRLQGALATILARVIIQLEGGATHISVDAATARELLADVDFVGRDEVEQLRYALRHLPFDEGTRRVVDGELSSAMAYPDGTSDRAKHAGWLRLVASLPWVDAPPPRIDIPRVRSVLDKNQAGLELVKDRILEHIASLQWWSDHAPDEPDPQAHRPPHNLLLVGPPGVGKTAICRSVAEATGRPLEIVAAAGAGDGNVLIGHSRTYVGAVPGSIIAALQRHGTRNLVIAIDEIDKARGRNWGPDPVAVLLSILDPDQSCAFRDVFLDLPIDISPALFICTANEIDVIDPAIVNRCEVITLEGYSEAAKREMLRTHLIPQQLAAHRVNTDQVTLPEATVDVLLDVAGSEPGVRNLQQAVGHVLDSAIVELMSGATHVEVSPARAAEIVRRVRARGTLGFRPPVRV